MNINYFDTVPSYSYESMKEALKHWHYRGFSLKGIREQGGYFEMEAVHPERNNLRVRGRTLQTALEGLERQIDTQFGEGKK